MTQDSLQPALGESLKAERQRRRLSLRELADEMDVGFNTLSRVERGHVPELRNYKRIVSWLGVEDDLFDTADIAAVEPSTPDLIAKHLYTDDRLDEKSASTMIKLIQDLYNVLAAPKQAFAVHLRSSQTFLPEVGTLLSDALEDMHKTLVEETR